MMTEDRSGRLQIQAAAAAANAAAAVARQQCWWQFTSLKQTVFAK